MTREHAQQIWPIIKAYGEGRRIEYNGGTEQEPDWQVVDLTSFMDHACRYRIAPLTFPPLPEGEEWSNPEDFTPEQIGEGYRPLTKREHEAGAHTAECCLRSGKWVTHKASDLHPGFITYRVPASTPFLLPEPQPELHNPSNLTPEQVGEGWRLITKDEQRGTRRADAEWWSTIAGRWLRGQGLPLYGFCTTYRVPITPQILVRNEISLDGGKTWQPAPNQQ